MSKKSLRIVFLCIAERRALYLPLLEELRLHPFWSQDVIEALSECIESAPDVLLMDVPTTLRMGNTNMNLLHSLRVSWPRIRCVASENGPPTAVSQEPLRRAPLRDALCGDLEQWLHPVFHRTNIRLPIRCRVRYQGPESSWHQSNSLDLSCGGLFLLSYQPVAPQTRLRLEIWDLQNSPLQAIGEVIWQRTWESENNLPGLGIRFCDLPHEACQSIADRHRLSQLQETTSCGLRL